MEISPKANKLFQIVGAHTSSILLTSFMYPHVAGQPMKRPAAAVMDQHVIKKPAMAASSSVRSPGQVPKPAMTDIFNELKLAFGNITRGAFVTKAYKRAEQRGLKAGMTQHNATLFARTNHSQASELFKALTNSTR